MLLNGMGKFSFKKALKKAATAPFRQAIKTTKMAARQAQKTTKRAAKQAMKVHRAVNKPLLKATKKSLFLPKTLTQAVFRHKKRSASSVDIPVPESMEVPDVVAQAPDVYQDAQEQAPESGGTGYSDGSGYEPSESGYGDDKSSTSDDFPVTTSDDFPVTTSEELTDYPYASGDADGGVDENNFDGLGKKFWQQKKFKKGLRKTALIAGTAAALYFTGGAAAAALKKGAPAAKTVANAGSYAPAPEAGDSTGYEGEASAVVPGAPQPVSSGPLFTPSVFDSAVKIATASGDLIKSTKRFADKTQQVQAPSIMDNLVTGKNIALIGAASALAVVFYMMRKGRK